MTRGSWSKLVQRKRAGLGISFVILGHWGPQKLGIRESVRTVEMLSPFILSPTSHVSSGASWLTLSGSWDKAAVPIAENTAGGGGEVFQVQEVLS